ncbi:uncharacterized protein LOC113495269 isoform X2 [Trichoplusia ni]|uniref:Uncharacterized protein LOC113495269 isoform X1 n=1 Tax=Trichoplusia ni TaxID=7111 RepID=A0A7E5VN75_TRINI|nr:uncharacterized protein LOC113495269 isoform X1 [Trichoplusia ni]XP_026729732.1 uncharacterized protein LOC113495269 isoform X2 [Trichoplusia ni]
MPNEDRNNTNRNNERDNQYSSYVAGAAMGLIGVAAGGALYYLTRSLMPTSRPAAQGNPPPEDQAPLRSATSRHSSTPRIQANPTASTSRKSDNDSISSYLSDLMNRISTSSGSPSVASSSVRIREVPPDNPVITNLNSLLSDIHVRYIKLKEFDLHYKVFDTIFQDLHKKMKEVDPYYRKYSSTVQFAGSHYDNLRIKKPDEFDMDIVIGLPLNIKTDAMNPTGSDILIEPTSAGFVQLKMGVQFQRLPMRDKEEWLINRAAYEWKDDSNYLLRSKFNDWFKSVVNKALNKFEVSGNRPLYYVEGVPYIIDKSESGPAMTLLISNKSRNFKLDVDLVPCLKFPEDRWPIGKSYRQIPQKCKKDYWMVVGKPNKESPSVLGQLRSWRLALHNQERELMHNSYNLRQAIRLVKKLRDSLGMKKIASYYIKTLFYWDVVEINDPEYWRRNNPATLFKLMVGKLHQALVVGKIPYFWNKDNNLIGNVDRKVLNEYLLKLVPLIDILDQPDKYKMVAKYLLTPEEFADYNRKFLHI